MRLQRILQALSIATIAFATSADRANAESASFDICTWCSPFPACPVNPDDLKPECVTHCGTLPGGEEYLPGCAVGFGNCSTARIACNVTGSS